MFANERNVELLSKIVTDTKRLVELRLRHFQLDCVTRFTELLSTLAVAFFVVLFLFLGLVVGSIALFLWLAFAIGTGWACLVIMGFYLLLAVLVVAFRHVLITEPLSRIIGAILLDYSGKVDKEPAPNASTY